MRHRYFLLMPPKGDGSSNSRGSYGFTIILTLHRFHLFSFKDSSCCSQLCSCGLSSLSGIFCCCLFVYFQAGELFKILNYHSPGTDQSEERLVTSGLSAQVTNPLISLSISFLLFEMEAIPTVQSWCSDLKRCCM